MGKNKSEKNREKESLNIGVMVLCIIGVVLTVFGFLVAKAEDFKLKVFSANGTVVTVQTKTNAEGITETRDITLSYIASNSNYTATIYNYEEDARIGDQMTLYYDFLSPEYVGIKRSGYIGYLAMIIGVALTFKTGPRFLRIIKDNYL